MRKQIVLLLFCLGICFLPIDGVRAADSTDGKGYANCFYEYLDQGTPSNSGGAEPDYSNSQKRAYELGITIYRDGDNVVRSYADIRCSDKSMNPSVGGRNAGMCKLEDYDYTFDSASTKMYDHFRSNSGWKCKDEVYVYMTSLGTDVKVYMTADECNERNPGRKCHSMTLSNEAVSQVAGSVSGDAFNHIDPESGAGDESSVSDEAIINSIFNWGNSDDSTKYSDEGVDPCALINGEIRQILHDVFLFISIGGIIILVVMTSISLVKVITASEDEALRNFLKGLWKRIICLIILLILPVLVTFIIQLVNNVAPSLGINSDNPLCNVTE